MIAAIAAISYLIAGFCATLGSVLCGVILWASALALFIAAVAVIKMLEKKKQN